MITEITAIPSSVKSHGENQNTPSDRLMAATICCPVKPMAWSITTRSVACARARSSRSWKRGILIRSQVETRRVFHHHEAHVAREPVGQKRIEKSNRAGRDR